MDIAAGLTLLGQATNIVKGLREIDKGFDLAALKARMADLYGTLAGCEDRFIGCPRNDP